MTNKPEPWAKVIKTMGGSGIGASVYIGGAQARHFTESCDDPVASAEHLAERINAALEANSEMKRLRAVEYIAEEMFKDSECYCSNPEEMVGDDSCAWCKFSMLKAESTKAKSREGERCDRLNSERGTR